MAKRAIVGPDQPHIDHPLQHLAQALSQGDREVTLLRFRFTWFKEREHNSYKPFNREGVVTLEFIKDTENKLFSNFRTMTDHRIGNTVLARCCGLTIT